MRWLAVLLWLTLMPAAGVSLASTPKSSAYEADILRALESAGTDPGLWGSSLLQQPLVALYAQRSYVPLWILDHRVTAAAVQLLAEAKNAERRGLLPTDYELPQAAWMMVGGGIPDASVASLDVAISVIAARFASDVAVGRVKPAEVGHDLDIANSGFDIMAAVRALASSRDVTATLDTFEPQLRHFQLLKAQLLRYRALQNHEGDLVNLPALPRAAVRPGESYAGAVQLRRLLIATGDMPQDAESTAVPGDMDRILVEALKSFQLRHGLDGDGILGRNTYKALTTPFATRIWQMELSLERMRWLPAFDTPPIIVNIPQFRLFAFRTVNDAAADILQMDVIVGEDFKARQTPVFAADMRYVVIQPYWDVPRSILRNELLPEIRADATWLLRHGYEIVRGDGDDSPVLPPTPEHIRLLEQGGARLRQKPGPANALGRVKFMFPNRHNVYLHDTPARALFSRSRRAFSHGCIRVSDPMALLAHVMRDNPDWSDERRDVALAGASPVRVALARPIRVFVLYGTALAKEDGTVQFFDDLYGHDAPLIAKLVSRRQRSVDGGRSSR